MARRTITTIEWTCDLCGESRDEDSLQRLYGPPGRTATQRGQVDVCETCMSKPVSADSTRLSWSHPTKSKWPRPANSSFF
jgi:hypothetical protein